MRNLRRGATVAAAVVAAATLAAVPAAESSVKNMVEACGVADDLSKLLENEVALVDVGAVARNGDGTYRLTTQAYTKAGGTLTLCTDSRFYGQTMVAGLPFRSAVQVGPDLVLTAWHNITFGTTPELYAIFGLRHRLVAGRCVPPDFERIPAADVYSVIDNVADGLMGSPPRDFLLLRLDRSAAARYPRVRRTGRGRADDDHRDRVTMISHPDRLAAKVDIAGRLAGYSDPTYTGPEAENLHPLQWSSGAMLYNRDAQILETVARSSLAGQYVREGTCWKVGDIGVTRATNDSLADFAGQIPPFELLVTPLDAVVHEGFAGDRLSNPTVARTVEVPASSPGTVQYRITPPATTAQGPQLLLAMGAPMQGSLPPGAGFDIEETVDASGVPCGSYEVTYSIADLTHGFTDVIRHVFRIACR